MPTNYNVKFATVPLTIQPSRVVPHPPAGHDKQAMLGDYIGFARGKGWTFDLEWGQDLVDDAPAAMLKTLKAAITTPTFELAFTWFDGNEWEFTVMWDEAISAPIHWGSVSEKVVVQLCEAA